MPEEEWDGTDRRRTPPVLEEVSKKVTEALNHSEVRPSISQNLLIVLVASVGLSLALSGLALILMFRLGDTQSDHDTNSNKFRRSLSCFLVEGGRAQEEGRSALTTDVLTSCGFVELPGED